MRKKITLTILAEFGRGQVDNDVSFLDVLDEIHTRGTRPDYPGYRDNPIYVEFGTGDTLNGHLLDITSEEVAT